MNIHVENLGPIRRADVSLNKPLTLFCGYNSSGKTYLSYIVYALSKRVRIFDPIIADVICDCIISGKSGEFPLTAAELWTLRESKGDEISNNLEDIFGISQAKANSLFKNFSIKFDTTKESFFNIYIGLATDDTINVGDIEIKIVKKPGEEKVSVSTASQSTSLDLSLVRFIALDIAAWINNRFAFHPLSDAVIFTVERNSIYTFNKELSLRQREILDAIQSMSMSNAPGKSIEQAINRTTRYPASIKDQMSVADDLANSQKRVGPFAPLADDIESMLLHGKVSVSKDGEVEFTPERHGIGKLPIHTTASMVKTLSSLIFYLRHKANENDLIIIDEPELNLHPYNQIILARVFARMVKSGLRLLVSTHSDYIIREINNLIMLSSIDRELLQDSERLHYSEKDCLSADQVGVYLFRPKGYRRVVSERVKVTDTGFDVATFDETIVNQNEMSENLYYYLLKSRK